MFYFLLIFGLLLFFGGLFLTKKDHKDPAALKVYCTARYAGFAFILVSVLHILEKIPAVYFFTAKYSFFVMLAAFGIMAAAAKFILMPAFHRAGHKTAASHK